MKFRKGLSILLAISMALSMAPGSVFAAEAGTEASGMYSYALEETENAGDEELTEVPESSLVVEEPIEIETEAETPTEAETEAVLEDETVIVTEEETGEWIETETSESKKNLPEPESEAGAEADAKAEADEKAADDLRATRPTEMWVEPTEANGIPARIDVFKKLTTGVNSPTYTCLLCLPGDVDVSNVFLSWDGGMSCTVNGKAYTSGTLPAPAAGAQTSYAFKSGSYTTTFKITTYKGSPGVQRVFIEIDESDGKPTVAQMKASTDHSVECSGIVYINGEQYELSKMKGRGNASWKESKDKKPYNLTLGEKINFPGVDSAKTKKWSFLAEVLDRSLLCNRAGFKIAEQLGIGQDTTSADVWMNGEYQGCYMVTPKTDSFVTKTGYMIEEDNYKEKSIAEGGDPQFTLNGLNEASGWDSCYNRITVKKIGDTLLGEETVENLTSVSAEIQSWLQDAWDAIRSDTGKNSKGKYYTEYIDIESFARMYLMHEYVKSYDVCAGSILFHRDGQTDSYKLIAGPLWDLDNAMGSVYQNSSLGKADDRRNGDRRSAQGDFIINVTEYKTSIYKTIYTKHTDFQEEVKFQYNKNKAAFENAANACQAMIDEIQDSALMNHAKVQDLGNGTGKNNHYYAGTTTLGSNPYRQTYVATTSWANYAANLKTYITYRSLWFNNNYTDPSYVAPEDCTHQYQAVSTVPATCTADGYVIYKCPICRDTYTEAIPMLGHDFHDGICSRCQQHYMEVTVSCEPGASVTVYTTKGYNNVCEEDVINPRDGDTGQIDFSGEGQVNFKVSIADGYELGDVTAEPAAAYKNLKLPDELGEGCYRLTKVKASLTINVPTTPIEYQITYDLADGALPTGTTNPSTYNIEDTITLNNPVKQGYTFAGWTGTDVETSTVNLTIPAGSMGERSYTANWTRNTFTVEDITAAYTYTGAAQVPALTVTDGTKTLAKGTDYSVSCSSNINAGTATVTVTGIGDYQFADEVSKEFAIDKAPLTVTANAKTITYGDAPANSGVSYAGFVNSETASVLGGELEYTYNYEQYDDVGSYKITPAGLTAENYAISYADGTLTVGAKEVGLSWGTTTFTYDGEAHVPTATATGLVNGDEVSVTVSGAQTNAGTNYTATATELSSSNYKLPSANTTAFTINTAAMTVTAEGYTGTYDGASHGITVTVDAPEGAAVTYSESQNGTYSATAPTYRNAGTYTVYYKVTKTNYTQVSGSETVKINPKEVGLSWGTTTFTYDGKSHVPTAAATGVIEGDTVTVTVSGAQTNAGTYTATASGLSSSNYKLPSANTTSFTINTAAMDVTAQNYSGTYDGASHGITVSVASPSGASVTYSTSESGTYSATAPTYKNAGTYTVYYKVTLANYTTVSGSAKVIISAKEVGLSWGSSTFTYDGASHAPTASATGVVTGDTVTVTVEGARTNAGTYTATASALSNSNYKLPSANTTSFTINPKEVGLSWGSSTFTYDGASHAPTASATGVVTGDTVTVTVEGARTNAGTYTATASALSNSNYKLPSANTTSFTINPKEVGLSWGTTTFTYDGKSHVPTATATGLVEGDTVTVTVEGAQTNAGTNYTATATGLSNSNYKLPSANTTSFTINTASMSVSAEGYTGIYDGASHGITVSVASPEGASVTYSTSESGTYSATVPTYKNAGEYTVYYKVTKSNYTEVKSSAKVTITAKEVGLSWGTSTFTYDGTAHAPTASATGLITGDTVTVTVTGSKTDAGTYTATASALSSSNYKLPGTKTKEFTINPKEIGLSWGTTTFTYDGTSHVPTATATGVISGDSVTVTVTGAQTNAGTYTATASELDNSNYKLPSANTTSFKINTAAMSVTAQSYSGTYDGAFHGITVNVASPSGAAVTYSSSASGTYTEDALTFKDAGEYTVYYKVTKSNYTQVSGSETVTITAKEVGLSWGATTFTYDGTAHVPTVNATGVIEGDTVNVMVTGAQTNAGTYTATASELDNSNYKLPGANTTSFTINTAAMSVTAKDYNGIYDGASHGITVSVASPEGAAVTYSTSESGTYTATAPTYKNAGEYTVYYKVTKTNYTEVNGSKTVKIAKKEVGLSWGTTTFTYDGKSHVPTATATGVISGDTVTVTVSGAQTDAGTDYTATATALSNSNYKLPGENTTKFTINTAAMSVSAAGYSGVYDGASHGITVNVASPEGASVTYSTSASGTYSATAPTYRNVGEYTVYYKVTKTNYTQVSGSEKVTITAKEVGLNWGTTTFTYDGKSHVPTATAAGVISGDTVTVTVSGAQTNAGTNYTATATALSNSNYKLPGENTIKFTINTAAMSVSAAGYSGTYDGASHGITVSVASPEGASVTYSTSASGTYSATAPTYKNAGEYTVYYKVTKSNYTQVSGSETVKINPKEVGLTWTNTTFTYDGEIHVPTAKATGVVSGDTVTVTVKGAKAVVGSYTATATELSNSNYKLPVETTTEYEITPKTVSLSWGAASFTYDGTAHVPTVTATGLAEGDTVTVTVSGAQTNAGSYTATAESLSNGNYKLPGSVTKSFTINPKEVGLSWANTSFTYDGASHIPTAAATGIVSGDTVTVTVSGAQTNAGSYTATATKLSNNNYRLPDSVSKAFTIDPKEVGLSWGTAAFTYNGKAQAPAAAATGLISGDTVTVTVSGAKVNAGSYTAAASALSNSNYKLPSANTKSFTIDPKEVGLSWTNTSFIYDGTAHIPTAAATGIIEGDTVSVTVEGAQTNAGSYTATATGLDNSNYKLPGANTTSFTISTAAMSVTAKEYSGTYDGASHGITVNAASPSGASVTYSISADGTYTATAPTYRDVGEYTVYYKVTKTNYTQVSGSARITITAKEVGLTWTNTAFTYDGKSHIPTATATGVIEGDTVSVTVEGAQTNAGTYTAAATSLDNSNYKLPNANTTSFTISTAAMNVTAKEYSGIYDGASHGITVTVASPEGASVTYSTSASGTYTAAAPTYRNVGEYTVYYKVTKTNYTQVSGSGTVTINPKEVGLTWTNTTFTYDGKSHVPTATATGVIEGDTVTVTVSGAQTNAGTYTATATALSSSNYKLPSEKTTSFTIGTAAMSVTDQGYSGTYNGASHGITVTVASPEGVSVTYSTSADGTYTTTAPTYRNVGEYTVYYKVTKTNYTQVSGSAKITITAKEVGLTWTNTTFTYDGKSHVPTATATGLISGDTVTVTVSGAETHAGSYTAAAAALDNSNYKLPDAKTKSFTINPKEVGLSWTNTTFTFDGKSHLPTATATGVIEGDTVTVTVSGAKINAGTYTATATALDNSNYKLPSANTTRFTIAAAAMNVSAKGYSGMYDGASHGITVTVVSPEGASVTYSSSENGTYTTTVPTYKNVGEYTVYYKATSDNYTQESGSAKVVITAKEVGLSWTNTTFTYDGKSHLPTARATGVIEGDTVTVTVSGAQTNAGSYTATATALSSSNYKLPANKTTSFTIKTAAMDVSAKGYTGTYDGVTHGITVTVVSPEGASVTYSSSEDGSYTTTAPTYRNVGEYTVYYKVTKDNYTETSGSAKVTITAKEVGLTWADLEFTYDGKSHVPTATATGVIEGDTVSVTVSGAQTNAGTYTAAATGLSSSNYKLPAAVTTPFTIRLAEMNVTSAGYTGTYDGENHGITVTVTVPSDAIVTYSESADGDYTEEAPVYRNVGEYTVYYKAAKENYIQAIGSAKVVITPKEVGLTWTDTTFTYDGTAHVPTATATGVIEGDIVTVTVEGAQTDAGTYTATAAALDNSNYKLPAGVMKQFTIQTAAMDVSASDYSGVYDGEAHGITVTVISPDGASVTYSRSEGGTYAESAPTYTNAGEYTVYYKVTKTNYTQVNGSAKVTIAKAEQAMPAIDYTDETISGKKDGTITGLTAAMEISTDGKTYTSVTTETISNLAPGTYYVRLAETDNYEASAAAEIVIAASDVQLTVTFEPNGGSEVETAYVDYGAKAAVPAAPSKQGYWFGGWYSDENLTDPYDFNTAVTDNITIYAKWNANSDTAYTIEHYLEGLDGKFAIDSGRTQSMAGTTGSGATASPLNVEGFSFDENNANNVTSGTIAANGSLVLKLYYTRNSYKVSYSYSTAAPADATALPADASAKYGAEVTVAADAAAAGHTFSGWSTTDADVANGKFTMPAKAVAFSGSWTVNKYTITFVDEDGVTVLDSQSVAYGETPVYAGETPTKAADADYKYSFKEWTPKITAVTGNATYKAVFGSEARRYGQPSWTWTPDDEGGYSAAAAVFTTNDGEAEFGKTETTTDIQSTTTAAECEKDGKTVYTASVTFGGREYTDSKTVVIPATGHKYGEATYVWADDNSKVTAKAVCEHDASHVVTETVETSYEVTKEPSVSETGTGVYTAEFSNNLFSRQTKETELPAVTYKLSETSLIMPTETTKNLTVTDNYGRTADALWSSSDESIATVTDGEVKALRYGKAEITAEIDGYSENCEVSTLFYDVTKTSDYYFAPVYWAADESVTKGYDGVYFGVGRNCARREVMIFLWRISGCPTEDAEGNSYGDAREMFKDMKNYGPDSDTNKAIAWGCAEGIAKGYDDGGFHPTASIVRKDVMIMLYRLAGKPAVSGTLTWPDCKTYKPASDTYKAILWGSQNKITNGYTSGPYAGQFGALVNCLREQIVTFMYRYSNL